VLREQEKNCPKLTVVEWCWTEETGSRPAKAVLKRLSLCVRDNQSLIVLVELASGYATQCRLSEWVLSSLNNYLYCTETATWAAHRSSRRTRSLWSRRATSNIWIYESLSVFLLNFGASEHSLPATINKLSRPKSCLLCTKVFRLELHARQNSGLSWSCAV